MWKDIMLYDCKIILIHAIARRFEVFMSSTLETSRELDRAIKGPQLNCKTSIFVSFKMTTIRQLV